MGYVVPNRALGAALWARLSRSESLRILLPGPRDAGPLYGPLGGTERSRRGATSRRREPGR